MRVFEGPEAIRPLQQMRNSIFEGPEAISLRVPATDAQCSGEVNMFVDMLVDVLVDVMVDVPVDMLVDVLVDVIVDVQGRSICS